MATQLDVSKLSPMPGYVLVKPAETEAMTASGIYLPENNNEKPQHGTVLAVGGSVWESGVKEVKSPVKVKDNVIYKKWGGNEVKIGDVEYQFLKFEDILAVVK
jgi:chaperonin GroES